MITTNPHGRQVDTARDEPTPVRPLREQPTDFEIEGPFAQRLSRSARAAECLVALVALIAAAFSAGFFGRHFGLF